MPIGWSRRIFRRARQSLARPSRAGAGGGRLARSATPALLGAALALGAAATGLGYLWLSAQLVESLRSDARLLAQTAFDPRLYLTPEGLVQAGEHLVRVSDIAGGSFVNAIGTEQGGFGERPALTWAEARLEGARWRLDKTGGAFDMFIGPEELGISPGLLVRMDAARRWQVLHRRVAELGLIALAAALSFAGAAGMIARRLISRPLGEKLAALRSAAAMRHQLDLHHKAERRRQAVRLARLRMQLSACLALLEEHGPGQPSAQAAAVDPDALIGDWLGAAVARGDMATDGVAPQGLPWVRGDPETLRRLFSLILETVRVGYGGDHPIIVITAATRDNEVEITARAEDGKPDAASADADSATLATAAIAALARRLGGRLVAHRGEAGGNAVIVRLRAAARSSETRSATAA